MNDSDYVPIHAKDYMLTQYEQSLHDLEKKITIELFKVQLVLYRVLEEDGSFLECPIIS